MTDIRTDETSKGTDADGQPSQWLTIAEAARILGKTERTIRRYASGEIKVPEGLEIQNKDGRVLVRVSGNEGREPDADGHGRTGVIPSTTELEALKTQLLEKELLIAGKQTEIARLQATIEGKEELIRSKEEQIEDLRKSRDKDHQSIEHLEILLNQVQRALPAPNGRKQTPASGDFDAPQAVEYSARNNRRRLWLWIVIGGIVLLGGGSALAWWMQWIP